MPTGWFDGFVECDEGSCPSKVKGYFELGDLLLGFCQHHFFVHEDILLRAGWKVAAKDGVLIKDSKRDKKR